MRKNILFMSMGELFAIFIVWFHDQLVRTFPISLLHLPLSKDLPKELGRLYVPPFE